MLEEMGLPELSLEQKENLCVLVEKAAQDYIKSKTPLGKIQVLDIDVEIEQQGSVTVTVDIELAMDPLMRDRNAEQLVNEATRKALEVADTHLRGVACKSKT